MQSQERKARALQKIGILPAPELSAEAAAALKARVIAELDADDPEDISF